MLRHAARERQWELADAGDAHTAQAIERHIEQHFPDRVGVA